MPGQPLTLRRMCLNRHHRQSSPLAPVSGPRPRFQEAQHVQPVGCSSLADSAGRGCGVVAPAAA
eukprot:11170601-Lingulodinium_polyedra.AAC.1